MKKFLSILACLAFVFVGGITLAACDKNHNVSTEAELVAAIKKGGDITLTDDIVLTKTVTVKKDVELNLNGYTITEDMTWTPEGANKTIAMFRVVNADLEISGGNTNLEGKISSNDLYLFYVTGSSRKKDADLDIKSGLYETNLTIVQLGGHSTCEIEGGTFKLANPTSYGTKYMLNKLDDSRHSARFDVSGGVFHGFNPSIDVNGDGRFVSDYECVVTENQGVFTVYERG